MMRRKAVRFSSEDSCSGNSTPDWSGDKTPTRSILRQTSSETPSPVEDPPEGATKERVTSEETSGQLRPIENQLNKVESRHAKSDPGSELKEYCLDNLHAAKQDDAFTEKLDISQFQQSECTGQDDIRKVNSNTFTRQKSNLYFDSGSKQFFTPTHQSTDQEVRVFKLSTQQPYINRWTGCDVRAQVQQAPGSRVETTQFREVVPQTDHCNKSDKVEALGRSKFTSLSFDSSSERNHHHQLGSSLECDPAPISCNSFETSTYASAPYRPQHGDLTQLTSRHRIRPSDNAAENYPLTDTSAVSVTNVTHNRTMEDRSGVLWRPEDVPKSQAKADLQEIGTRLGNYIQYVREVSEGASTVDLASFVDTIRVLEEDVAAMKALYERELDQARQQAEELRRGKQMFEHEASKSKTLVAELENRLALETDRNRQTVDEINTLSRTVMQKDRNITDLKIAMQKPIQDLDVMTKEYDALLREKEDFKRRYDHELLEHRETGDSLHQLQQKLAFDAEVAAREKRDLSERLQGASDTVLTLEAKIREITHADTALAEMLQRVRDVAEAEIERYKQESDARFNQNVFELQSQLNSANRKLEDLTERNDQLHTEIGDHVSRVRELEGEVASLDHQKRCVDDVLARERMRAQEHVKALDRKLTELQELLVNKMKEINAARDAQIPLKAEIETLRTLLTEEEHRLRLPIVSKSELPPRNVSYSPDMTSAVLPTTGSGYYTNGENTQLSYGETSGGGYVSSPPSRDSRPLGPVRARSAPVASIRARSNLMPASMGQGKDYFDEMFGNLRLNESGDARVATSNGEPGSPAPSLEEHRSSSGGSTAISNLKILEIHPEGRYIRLQNTATSKVEEVGGFTIQQNVAGSPVAVYRFAPRVRFPSGTTVTVWAGGADPSVHQPPSDYYFKEQLKWGTGPECTTILCRPNGQAIAWSTTTRRVSRDAFLDPAPNSAQQTTSAGVTQVGSDQYAMDGEELPECTTNVNAPSKEPVYLRREKECSPSLHPPKHPHGINPHVSSHPHTGQPRPLTYGNDNSTVSRQSRVQSTRPDPIPGAPYAGASAQRMGSASLRRYQTSSASGSGVISNKSAGKLRLTTTVG